LRRLFDLNTSGFFLVLPLSWSCDEQKNIERLASYLCGINRARISPNVFG
jgi:hypothetical protein